MSEAIPERIEEDLSYVVWHAPFRQEISGEHVVLVVLSEQRAQCRARHEHERGRVHWGLLVQGKNLLHMDSNKISKIYKGRRETVALSVIRHDGTLGPSSCRRSQPIMASRP
jgi:hypothetical protein